MTIVYIVYILGLSVLYFHILVFFLFQNRQDVRKMIEWLYPDLKGVGLSEKVSAELLYPDLKGVGLSEMVRLTQVNFYVI